MGGSFKSLTLVDFLTVDRFGRLAGVVTLFGVSVVVMARRLPRLAGVCVFVSSSDESFTFPRLFLVEREVLGVTVFRRLLPTFLPGEGVVCVIRAKSFIFIFACGPTSDFDSSDSGSC